MKHAFAFVMSGVKGRASEVGIPPLVALKALGRYVLNYVDLVRRTGDMDADVTENQLAGPQFGRTRTISGGAAGSDSGGMDTDPARLFVGTEAGQINMVDENNPIFVASEAGDIGVLGGAAASGGVEGD